MDQKMLSREEDFSFSGNKHYVVVDDNDVTRTVATLAVHNIIGYLPTECLHVDQAMESISRHVVESQDGDILVIVLDSQIPIDSSSPAVDDACFHVLAHLDNILEEISTPRIYVSVLRYTGNVKSDYSTHKIFSRRNVVLSELGKPMSREKMVQLFENMEGEIRSKKMN